MAKIIDFEDASGVEHATSYWRLVQANISVADESANFVFYGYATKALREAKKSPLPGAVKSYAVSGVKFREMMAAHLSGELNVMQAAYQLATETKDKDSGEVDADGKKVMVSFFDGGTDDL